MNLQHQFDEYNRKYFGGRIPRCRVKWDKKLHRRGYMGECDPPERIITISIYLKPLRRATKMSLFHEMVHVYLDHHGHPDDSLEHGPRFQCEMRRLAREGAFDPLW